MEQRKNGFLLFTLAIIFAGCVVYPPTFPLGDDEVYTGIIDLGYTPLAIEVENSQKRAEEQPYEIGVAIVYKGNKNQAIEKYRSGTDAVKSQPVLIDTKALAKKMAEISASAENDPEYFSKTMLIMFNVSPILYTMEHAMLRNCNEDQACEETVYDASTEAFGLTFNFGVTFVTNEELGTAGNRKPETFIIRQPYGRL